MYQIDRLDLLTFDLLTLTSCPVSYVGFVQRKRKVSPGIKAQILLLILKHSASQLNYGDPNQMSNVKEIWKYFNGE